MSKSTLTNIKQRIAGAPESSPIAVYAFKSKTGGYLDARFASTFNTQIDIKQNNPDIVGVYHGMMDTFKVDQELRQAERGL